MFEVAAVLGGVKGGPAPPFLAVLGPCGPCARLREAAAGRFAPHDATCARLRKISMLRIYSDVVTLLSNLRPALAGIARRDRDLARQLRRAATSVLLNLAEGSGLRGGHRRERHATALGSALEVRACLDAAVALGYVPGPDETLLDQLDKVVATLHKLAR